MSARSFPFRIDHRAIMNKLKNVVVGIDFSTRSKSALIKAARLARQNEAQLHVIHVVEEEYAEDLARHERRSPDDIRKELKASADKTMTTWTEEIDLSPGTSSGVVYGHPVEELVRKVDETNAELLVAGVRGIFNDATGAGAQATRLVRRAPCKVLLVEEGQAEAFQSVVAAIDFSATSERVAEQAVHVAGLDGSELHFLHIYSAPWEKFHYLHDPNYSTAFRESYAGDLERQLREFVGDTGTAKVSFHLRHHQQGGQGINEFCAEKDADLVIMGTRGRTSLKYLVMGSTAEQLLSQRPCSVLTVPPPAWFG